MEVPGHKSTPITRQALEHLVTNLPSQAVDAAREADDSEPLKPDLTPTGHGGLIDPAADGRRRPLLGMRVLSHISELAP